jgi:tetratricopeptide (TPR) repeat protein
MRTPEEILQEALAAHFSGRLAAAEVGYNRVLRMHPANPEALHGLGAIYFGAGATAKGIDCVLRSVHNAPQFGPAWNTLGSMYMETGKAFEAKLAYQRATEVQPDLSEAWYNLAVCSSHEKNTDAMLEFLRKAVACPRAFTKAYELLAKTLAELGRAHEATQTLNEWLARDPENPIARQMAGAPSADRSTA